MKITKKEEKETKKVLDEEFKLIVPDKETLNFLSKEKKEIVGFITNSIKQKKIKASIFVGGSFAKGTIIKKDKYDIDLFVRFDSKYKDDEISNLLSKIIPKSSERIHGSRDYFKFKPLKEGNLEFEIIPVLDIKNPKHARNITDLSYFHVKYINNKIKKQKSLAKEIMLAKAFTHYSKSYGAESYIQGFSGYAVELLIVSYKTLFRLMDAIINSDGQKIILDPEKLYKNQTEIKMLMNESKMHSPIVLVDPTFKDRNALAALSNETLNTFKKACVSFLNNPSLNFFIKKDQEREFRNKNKSNIKDLITLEINTHRQSGDIAGTKLKKAYNFLLHDMKRFFDIKDSFFTYDEKENKAKILIIAKTKKEIILTGPPIEMKEQFQKFKKMHNKIIIKNKISSAIEKGYKDFNEFLGVFQAKNEKALESMGVDEIKIV